jgi:hypothetical protein
MPRFHGGTDDPDNLVDCCRGCNILKGCSTVEQYRSYLQARHSKNCVGFTDLLLTEVIYQRIVFYGEGGEYGIVRLISAVTLRRRKEKIFLKI